MEITNQIILFSKYLSKAMGAVDELMENHDWDYDPMLSEDWWKASWELFIERELFPGHYISSLSLDMNSRVISPEAKADYVIIARQKNRELKSVLGNHIIPIGNGLRITDLLTKVSETNYGYYPPFDVAKIYNDKTKEYFYIHINEANFFGIPLDKYLISL